MSKSDSIFALNWIFGMGLILYIYLLIAKGELIELLLGIIGYVGVYILGRIFVSMFFKGI